MRKIHRRWIRPASISEESYCRYERISLLVYPFFIKNIYVFVGKWIIISNKIFIWQKEAAYVRIRRFERCGEGIPHG